jgi:LuxR family maltose regulon positive regulatory protein
VTAGPAGVVIATKLFMPSARQQPVPRPRLHHRLEAGLQLPLTLVVAPAGWGKSTLVSEWLRQLDLAAGWVSLDRFDDDTKRFWQYLLLAADRAAPGVAAAALRRLEAAGSDVVRDVLPVFVNDVAAGAERVVVVLDDYHLVAAAQVHESIATLLDRCPPQLHLIISTRADPPLALSRLRIHGDLAEIRAEQLRFTAGEAANLLAQAVGTTLDSDDVERLVIRTEGWAAGLQLAAIGLAERTDRSEFINRFTGADRHLVDYLGEEVLAHLPETLRDFLLRTSPLNRMCAPLADAVTGRDDGAALLDEIYRANLFLTPLDDEQVWFRYHQLFRGILQHELTRVAPAARPELHRRAAIWYAGAGDAGEAVDHAIESKDPDLAGRMIADSWLREFNAGHLQTVRRWLSALPAQHIAGDVQLSVAQVWLALDAGRLDDAESALTAAEQRALDDAHLRVLRTLLTYKIGDVSAAARMLAAAAPGSGEPFVSTVHSLLTGVTALWSGDADRADVLLRVAAERAVHDENRLAHIYAQGCLAMLAVETGDLAAAHSLLARAEAEVASTVSDAHFVAMFPALARARLTMATGTWDDALASATRAVDLARRGAGRIEVAAALLTAAAITRGLGEPPAGFLAEARAVLARCADPGPVVLGWLNTEQRVRTPAPETAAAEQLTERELDILRLLPRPLSQRELAQSLFVTPNTLKTHLRAIYRKLNVESREAAVSRARALGLL